MEKKKILMKSKVAAPNLLRTLHSLYQFGHLCDVTVHTQHLGIQEEFLVHKAVLAASSNYFRGLFLHDEMLETKNCTVTLPDIYTEEFTSFLEFVYTAEVEIEAEKLQRMKEIAERLECKDLLDICEEVKAEGRKGLDLSLHLKSQLCDDGDAPWPRVPPEETRRRSGSSQVAVMPVQRKLWEKRKREKDRLLAGYQLGEGEKKRDPQACPYCDKVVGSKCGLTVHIRSHTGERPYRCERCPATFAQRSAYNAHLRKIHESGRERELLPVYWMVVRPNVTSCNEDPTGDPRGGTSEPEQWTRERHQEEEPSPAPEANCGNEEEEWKEKEGGRGEGDGDEGERSVKGEEEVGSEVEERRDSEEVCTEEDGGYSHEEDGEEHALNEKLKTKKVSKNGMSKKATYVISCEKCKEQFVSRKKYVDHCRDVHQCPPGKAYRCDICGKSFASYNSWKEHRACVHSEERRFACTLCTATFKRKRDVRSHAVRKHEGRVKRPLCSVCGKILSSRTALVFHMRTHTGEKPHQCGLCHARFAQPSQLKIHTRSHTGEKPYICEDCGASFADKGKLTAHKRTHTGERLFKCDVCGKHFATKEYLKCHKRCHMGAKPYKCQVCGKTFGLRASLAQHSNVHAETRPYFCEQCGKTFTQQGALRRHQRIHTGEKPYKCRACERTFTDMSTLRRHASIHDRNAHWRSFLIDLTTKKDHNWSKIEPFSEAGAGEEDSVPETWLVDRGKLSNPQSGALKQVEPVPSSVGNVEDTERSILFL